MIVFSEAQLEASVASVALVALVASVALEALLLLQ